MIDMNFMKYIISLNNTVLCLNQPVSPKYYNFYRLFDTSIISPFCPSIFDNACHSTMGGTFLNPI